MIKEMTLKQAMTKLSRLETELSSYSTQMRYKYKNEIISVDTKPVDNSKRIEKAKELYKDITDHLHDIHVLRCAINKANNTVNENGMTILEMIDMAKIMRNHRLFMKGCLNDPEFVADKAGILEKGCLINDFLEEKIDLISPEEIENISNQIDILNNEIKIVVDLKS